jgi:hypothetical protein
MTEIHEPAPLATVDSPDESAEATRASIGAELKRLGELLSSALRAAAGTKEAQDLKAELKEGVEALRREMDSAVESTRGAAGRVRVDGTPSAERLRNELADALRAVNRALDRMAQSVEPGTSSAAPPPGDEYASDDS